MIGAIRELKVLKSSLSRILSLAQSGEIIEVTSHNKPIARITGSLQLAAAHILHQASDEVVQFAGFDARQMPTASSGCAISTVTGVGF